MKCPSCGKEIADGYLYCEYCGKEIQIVPDFEPEIENSIIETLSTVAEEISPAKKEKTEESVASETEFFDEEPLKNKVMMRLVILVSIIVVAILSVLIIYFNLSVPYQIKKAKDHAASKRYEEAVRYLDKAISLDGEKAKYLLLQANYIYLTGDADYAAEVLYHLIEKVPATADEMERAYTYLIAIYDVQGKYEEINTLLANCADEKIISLFSKYMASEPVFSCAGGSYDVVIPLKLSANTTGKIYYTMDGSIPDEKSTVYNAPIFLESGNYMISAIFVNDYGIRSNVVQNWYEINLTVPNAPEVLLYSGKYTVPTKIEVNSADQGTIYYTTDGSEPNENSLVYTNPIDMPLGRSNFKFVVISDEMVASEIVSRSYEFVLESDITPEAAADAVKTALIERNVLKDMNGTSKIEEGKYIFTYDSLVEIEKNYYYVLSEFFYDAFGNTKKTGLLYAVHAYDGTPNRLIYDENGQMGLISLK